MPPSFSAFMWLRKLKLESNWNKVFHRN
jgi:hypothetical protein